ncbi:MAG: DUF4432 family protein [Eubacteriales bacterium]|nr:DUF4432 family protein [Eubacteriales bacterium]
MGILKKEDLLRHIGSMQQVMGAREVTLRGGRQEGVRTVEFYNDTGFSFAVLLDKGMNIGPASFCGKSLTWLCKNGVVAPQYFENGGIGFLRSFGGGLVTACGLTQVGDPCVDGDTVLGIHDRIDNIPAERYSIEECWEDGDYNVLFKGSARQSCLYYENLLLTREIAFKMGEKKFKVTDIVVNEGFNDTPFMLMYHMNFGYPVVSEYTRLYSPAKNIWPWNEDAKNGNLKYSQMCRPTSGYHYECFVHEMPKDNGKIAVALINHEQQFGAYVKYSPKELPTFNTWKMMGEQDYVMTLEPGINIPEGRLKAREGGRLHILKPNDVFTCSYEMGVLSGENEIQKFLLENHLKEE